MKVLIMLPAHPRLIASSALLVLCSSSLAFAQDAAPPPPPPTEEEEPAAPAVNLSMFADTFVSYNSAKSGTPVPYHRAYDNNAPYDPLADFPTAAGPDGAPVPSSFGSRNGFGLSFIGLDASFDTGVVGATAFLRFGPSVPIFYAADMGITGLDSILGGYLTLKPIEGLVIDAGYFGTIFGAEVAEGYLDLNYTRGALYYAMQPFYHFGAKAAYSINDTVTVRAMVVNGANNSVDENDAPALGLQLALNDLGGVFDLSVGGFYESGDDSTWGIESFVDVVGSLTLGDFTLLANFDYNTNRGTDGVDSYSYWGIMGTAAYAFTPQVGIAVRGEYLSDPDNGVWSPAGDATLDPDFNLVTLTGTLDLKPWDHIIIRPEFRYETASGDIFYDSDGAPTDGWFTAVLGLIATTN
jgi:putative OmpL-like beta-barrel porin-2